MTGGQDICPVVQHHVIPARVVIKRLDVGHSQNRKQKMQCSKMGRNHVEIAIRLSNPTLNQNGKPVVSSTSTRETTKRHRSTSNHSNSAALMVSSLYLIQTAATHISKCHPLRVRFQTLARPPVKVVKSARSLLRFNIRRDSEMSRERNNPRDSRRECVR